MLRLGIVCTAVVLAAAGFGLIALNVYGLIDPADRPAGVIESRAPPGTPKEYRDGPLERLDGESETAYARRLTMSVHYRLARGTGDRDSGIPARENFWLWAKHKWSDQRDIVNNLELVEHERALRRGYGLCSQFSLIIQDILMDQGIPAGVALLEGHVVATVKFESGREMILDGDYGIVMPYSIAQTDANPKLVERHYLNGPEAPKATDGDYRSQRRALAKLMREIYAPPNRMFYTANAYAGTEAYERDAYRMKWRIPAALLGAAAVLAMAALLGPRVWRRVSWPRAG